MMIRRRNCWISVLLAAAMLLSMLPAGVLLTQAGTDGPWSDAEVGTYRVVTAAPENNLLAGLTPTGWPYNNAEVWKTKNGTDMAKLTDGALSTTGSGDYVEFELLGAGQGSGDWRQYTFDLGAAKAVQEFLLGSCGGDNAGLRECWVQVYAGSKADDLYAEANKVAEKKNLTAAERNVLLRATAAVEARYVGFRLYTPAGCAWANDTEGFGIGPWYDTRRLGELGVYSDKPVTKWTAAAKGSWTRVEENSAVLKRPNLLSGLTPKWGDNDWGAKDGTDLAVSADGKLSVAGDLSTRMLFNAPWGDWLPLTYDLGCPYELQEFVVASSQEGKEYAPHLIHIYVSETKEDLYEEKNRVIQAEKFDVTGQQWQFKADTAKVGQYVGFRFYCADGTKDEAGEPNAFLNGERISNIWYGCLRIGEIGVYSDKPVTKWTAAAKGSWTRLTAENAILQRENRLKGVTPQWGENNWLPKDGTDLAASTDGKLCKAGETTARTVFETPFADWLPLTYELDRTYELQEFVVAGSGDGEKYAPHLIHIYVSETEEDLYEEKNRVIQAEKFDVNGHEWIFKADTSKKGRYVGFRFYCPGAVESAESEPNAFLNGQPIFNIWYTSLRLGEIGVYSEKPVKEPTAGVKGSWLPLTENADILKEANLLTGITPTSGNTTSPLAPKDDTVLSVSTDGKLSVKGDTSSRTVFKAPTGDWLQMSYRLDAIYSLQNFVVAGSKEGSGYVPHLIRIYVGQRLSNLYAEENRVVQAEKFDVTGQEWEFFADAAKEGQYVGFEFYCPDGNKSEAEEPNAYCNGQKISAIWYECLRIGELGAYGDRVGDAPPEPVNLIAGKEPADAFQIEARGIDNKTAVSATGEVGTGNTGTLKDPVALVFEEPSSNLTDGDVDTRGATSHSVKIPLKNEYDLNYQTLQYDTPWQVLVYHLGGESRLQEIRVASAGEDSSYYTAGVQYYASYRYADLFKNESLLYTTGGEYYHYDEANGVYMQDVEKDANNQRVLSYVLSDEQAAETYRFIAVVVTRPYGTYDKTYPTQRVVGYHSARMSEIVAEGTLVAPEVPPRTAYDQQTSIGNVRVQVSQLNADDIEFFDQVLGGFSFEAAALPTGIDRNTYGNWLTMDGDRMYTIRLVDKTGKALTDEQLGGRLVGITLPATAAYHQTVGRVKDGRITPMLNAYTRPDGTIQASALNYPEYHNQTSNREQAIIRSAAVSLVYLKFNDLDTINRLNGNRTDKPLQVAFVAGESRTAPSLTYLWVMAVGSGGLLAAASGWWLYRRRRSVGKGGKPV